MEPDEVTTLYVGQAQQLEEQGKYKEAERYRLQILSADLYLWSIVLYIVHIYFDILF